MSGLSAVRHSLEAIGEHSVDDAALPRVLHHIKEIGQTGRIVDADELRLIVSYLSRHPETRAPVEAVGR